MKLRKMAALMLGTAAASMMLTSAAVCAEEEYSDDEIINFTMFSAMPGSEINDDNEIMDIIAHKVGAKVKETWLTGQTAAEAVGTIIASGDYPDFIDGGDGMMALYDEG